MISPLLATAKSVVDQVTYRTGYALDVGEDEHGVYLEWVHWRPDVDTSDETWGHGGRRYLSDTMTVSDIVRVAFSAALAYEEHEVREFFHYRGAAVFGPHMDVEALVDVADRLDVR